MGTEVLRPQDCLIGRVRDPHPVVFHRRRSNYGNFNPSYVFNPRSTRKPAVRFEKPDQRKRSVSSQSEPSVSKRSGSSDDLKMERRSLSMEKVTILRRGESLDSNIKSQALGKEGDGLVVLGTQRLGPDPRMVPKQIRIVDPRSRPMNGKCDMYAGSAFATSPAPSSLPLPSFSKKKQVSAIVDDSATRDLRRLLRLDL
ncbi:hypothetical protein I3760_02G089800 [Carya illinoinensis]|uniref:Uncharacterized protein n=1 Tax=Carya illinoinensis TaxID=32201 RepID=A0A8T1RDE7_CARIL|nr:uncharacterized protein LOC122300482 [Carya illinoinensis]KAG2721622.1 hypothetical protein I3760_02G089800 [Carya illinoinensis]KAG6664373.1 hypothetical protein CIPAW_02G088800 [Carya illinoinensis]KAG6726587.1 hypothetical protein I3842_02G087800 [Carya illinoinensis]KAG6726588.1 hypothetical protein I3842_02G087800 [Carya illinoinensis]